MAVRYGIVGCGAISGTHASAIKKVEGAELTAFFDIVPEKAIEAARTHGGAVASGLDALLDAVDAVCVCVPSGLHGHITLEAAKAGKHVLSEKPIEVTSEAAVAMIEACDKAGVKFGVISQHRMSDRIQHVRQRVQAGDFGKMLAADVYIKWYRTQAYYDSGDWRGTWELDGGGCLMNQGVHYIDMVQWIMGGIKSVRAQTRTAAHDRIEVEDIANALIEYRTGAVGVLQGSTSYYPGLGERIDVHGTYGTAVIEEDVVRMLEVDPVASQQGLYGGGTMAQPAPNVSVTTAVGGEKLDWGELHRRQIEDFTNAILEDRQPFMTGRDAIEPLKVILAVYESARRGGESVSLR